MDALFSPLFESNIWREPLGRSIFCTESDDRAMRNLFSSGVNGVWFDPSDLNTLFQDSTGLIPVTAADQPAGLMLDKSGNGNHASQATSSKRPMLRTDGRLWWLEFDGVDDCLRVPSIALYTNIYLGLGINQKTGAKLFIEHGPNANTTEGFYFYGSSAEIFTFNRGMVKYSAPGLTDWIQLSKCVAELINTSSNTECYRNKAPVYKGISFGTNPTNSILTSALNIMSRNQAMYASCVDLYSMILVSNPWDGYPLDKPRAHLATKAGVVF